MEFRLLGTIEASIDGQAVELGPARQRCVLVVLLLEVNRVVSVDQLVDRVWDEDPPHSARGTLRSYLSRLRKTLAGTDKARITQQSGGYLLTVDESAVDAHRFRRLVADARTAGNDEHALALFKQALKLWRGEPFADLDTPWLASVRGSLERDRLAAVLDHVDVALRCGQHAAMLSTLAALTHEQPLDERVAGQLMLALYRAGRQADALEAFHRTRQGLAEELGVDPGPELRSLHEQILRGDPALAKPPATEQDRRNDLPGDIADFTGREQEMARLLAALPSERSSPATAVVIEAIDGMAGVGKTTLATHAAHRLAHRYPDAQMFIDLHGHTPGHAPITPTAALDVLLRAWGVSGDRIPHDPEARAALWRAELAGRKALVVLDNAADAAQVRPLLPGSAGCLALITSRRRLADLEAARILSLDVLPRADAIALFARIVADDRVTAEPTAVHQVVALCGDLPLAIRIAAARLATRPMWTVASLVDRLRDGHRRLAELTVGDRNVAAAFTLSYQHLTPDQQRMFRLLGLHPGPDIDRHAAAALAHRDLDTAERLLEDLVDTHLLQQHQPGRYRFHDLLRQHASTTAHQTDPETDQRAALTRLVDYYVHSAYAADRSLAPYRDPIDLRPPAPGCHPRPIEDEPAALAWLDAEHANLLALHQMASAHGWYAAVWHLAWNLDTFHWRRGYIQDNVGVWQAAVAAAEQLGDLAIHSRTHRLLGYAYTHAGQPAESIQHFQQALTLAERANDTLAQGHIHRGLAWAWPELGGLERALEHATHALRLYQALALPKWEADMLNAVGWLHARLGRYEPARTHCEAALSLARSHNHRIAVPVTLDSLGYIAHHTGDGLLALDYYRQALSLYRDFDHAYFEANTLDRLGQAQYALGQHDQARDTWNQVLRLYQAQHRFTEADRIQLQLAQLDEGG